MIVRLPKRSSFRMKNSLFSRTVGALWDKIYQEAMGQAGTWSLATYRDTPADYSKIS